MVVAALLVALLGCAPGREDVRPARPFPAPPPEGSSSLMLVSLDTFRADRAGCGGDPAARTPNLDRLARTGIQFEHGLSPVPITLPSHASILTGENPPAHGVRDNGTFRLPDAVPTVAERLRDRGFATGAFVAAFPLDSRFGLDRGFDVYDDDRGARGEDGVFAMDQRGGGEVTADAAEWLASVPAGRRVFAFVHLFEAHSPWNAPAPRVAAAGGDGYRADVAEADHWLGAAVRAARERGGFWICVVGDHGESLGEHRESTHGLFVYESTLDVPAVLWPAPEDEARGLRPAAFRLIDFPATAFARLGLPPGDAPGIGRPLPAATGATTAADAASRGATADAESPRPDGYFESFYGYFHYGWSPLRGVRDGSWKYVEAPTPELYDLAADPGERRNVAAEHPERVAALAERTRREAARETAPERIALDEEARDALESLGYATGGTEAEGAAAGEPPSGSDAAAGAAGTPNAAPRPDPKAMAKVLLDLERAQAALAAGQPEAALGLLRDAVSRDPRNKDLHHMMGLAHAMAGRPDWAVDSFRRALELPPHRNDRVPRFELASAWLRLGEPARAAEELERILAESPDDATSWYHLGVARSALGLPEEARKAWEKAVSLDPGLKDAVEAAERAGKAPDPAARAR